MASNQWWFPQRGDWLLLAVDVPRCERQRRGLRYRLQDMTLKPESESGRQVAVSAGKSWGNWSMDV